MNTSFTIWNIKQNWKEKRGGRKNGEKMKYVLFYGNKTRRLEEIRESLCRGKQMARFNLLN